VPKKKKTVVRISLIGLLSVIIFCGCLSYCRKTSPEDKSLVSSIPETESETSEKKAAKDIIQYFRDDEQIRLHFITQLDNMTQANLRNNEELHLKTIYSLTDISLPSTRLFVTDQKSEDIEKISPAFLECLLWQLGDNWYLDWSSAINDFRPLNIKLQKDLKETTNVKYLFNQQDINLCRKKSFEHDQMKPPSTSNEHLVESLAHFLIDRFNSEYIFPLNDSGFLDYFNDIMKQLAFLSPADSPGIYDIYYFDENLYGSFLLRKKTAWLDDLNILVPQTGSGRVFDFLSQILEINDGVAVFNTDSINGVVSEQMTHRSGKSGRLTDQEKMVVNQAVSNEIYNLMFEKISSGRVFNNK
jgi:hypothetical protein